MDALTAPCGSHPTTKTTAVIFTYVPHAQSEAAVVVKTIHTHMGENVMMFAEFLLAHLSGSTSEGSISPSTGAMQKFRHKPAGTPTCSERS